MSGVESMSEVAARASKIRSAPTDSVVDAQGTSHDSGFRGLVETALQGIIVHSDWEIVYANPAAARTLGYASVSDLVGVGDLLRLIPRDDHARVKGYYDARLKGEPAPERYQARLLHQGGSTIYVELLASAVTWQGKRAVQAAFIDISERVRAQERLRESEERYVLAMNGADEGMWDWHVDTDTVYVSPNVWRYMGLAPADEALGSRFWFERIHPDDREHYYASVIAHLRGEMEFLQSEVRMRVHEDTYCWFSIHALALRHDDGRAYRVAGSFHDITQRKHDEQVLSDRLRFDDLLTRVSAEFIALPSSQVDAAIERTLEVIGRSLEVDRGWYLQANRNDPGLFFTHEWCADGVHANRHDGAAAFFSAEEYPWTWNRLLSGTPVTVSCPDDYPPEAQAERDFAIAQGVQSLVSVFLDVDGVTVGVLGFETVKRRRIWSDEVVNQLKLLDQVITNAVVRKKADTALRESKELLQTFLDNTPALMSLKSLDKRYLLVNRGYREFVGRPREEILGSSPLDFLTDDHAAIVIRHDKMVLETDGAVTIDQDVKHFDGHDYCLRATKFPVYDTDDKLIGIGCYSVDITKLRQMEQALREREALINTISENFPGALYRRVLQTDGRLSIPFISESLQQVLGIATEDVVADGQVLIEAMHPEDRGRWMKALEESAASLDEMSVDIRVSSSNGQMRWMRCASRPQRLDDGTVVWDGVILDITDEIHAVEALRESEERFRNLVEGSLQGIGIVDRQFAPVFVNEAYAAMFGYPDAEEMQRLDSHLELFAPRDRDRILECAEARLRGEDVPVAYELDGVRKDGCTVHMVSTLRLISWKGRPAFQITATDITERKRTEARLEEYQQQLRRLASEISLAEEKERRRIASELHDGAIQDLALAKIKLGELERNRAKGIDRADFDEVRELIECSIHHARNLIFELSPPVLYELGLAAAVEWMGEQFQSHYGIDCRVMTEQGDMGLRADMEVVLFQVLRELLINVVKHADASKVEIGLRRVNEDLVLQVSDDGQGFDATAASLGSGNQGFGLFNIRERLGLFGARFELDSSAGTRITVTAPLTPEAEWSAL